MIEIEHGKEPHKLAIHEKAKPIKRCLFEHLTHQIESRNNRVKGVNLLEFKHKSYAPIRAISCNAGDYI